MSEWVLQDDDLVMVNRGGTNYKLTGAELHKHDRLLDTDEVMMQHEGALYRISIGEMKAGAVPITNGATNFFLAERDERLYAVENPFRQIADPAIVLTFNTTGLGSSSNVIQFACTGASTTENGTEARLISLDSDGNIVQTRWLSGSDSYYSLTGTFTSNNVDKILVVGQYTRVNFKGSKGLIGAKWTGGVQSWNRMFKSPTRLGESMFEDCDRVVNVFGMPGYGSAPPAGFLTSLSSCFRYAKAFNGNLSSWDTSGVTDMSYCFSRAEAFAGWNTMGSDWDVSNVETFQRCFDQSPFNSNINAWNTQKAYTMNDMFKEAASFNQPLDNWFQPGNEAANQSNGKNNQSMQGMFQDATSFNQDLKAWCVSKFSSEPSGFSTRSGLAAENQPLWGTCPTR